MTTISNTSYDVHRLSFGDWMPSPIRNIASDPFSSKIAVGREDGDIEICSSSSKWYPHVRIPGREDFRLQSLVWSPIAEHAGRLFGISLHGIIFEVDFLTLSLKHLRHTTGEAAWCLSASALDATLIVGCDDGMAREYQYDSSLEYSRVYPSTNASILSICHHPNQPRVYMGCGDGTIRCHDSKTGRGIFRMRGEVSQEKQVIILCLVVTRDSLVISGDSLGNVQMWNGELGVLNMTFHQHTAEILAIALSHDEKQIFASGVDSRVTCIQRLMADEKDDGDDKDGHWIYSTAHRPHSHDVYALAIKQQPSSSSLSAGKVVNAMDSASILISGGLDGKLCLYAVEHFAQVRPSWILPVPARGLVHSAYDGSIIAMRHRRHIDIWHIHDFDKQTSPTTSSSCKLSCQVQLKHEDHIHCFALSSSGRYLASSSAAGTRLWQVSKKRIIDDELEMMIDRISLPSQAQVCLALALAFSHTSSSGTMMAVALSTGAIVLLNIAADGDHVTSSIHHVFPATHHHAGGVHSLVFSEDGLLLAGADTVGGTFIYDLDVMRLHWRIPQLSSPITALAFQPTLNISSHSILTILTANNDLYLADAVNMTFLALPLSSSSMASSSMTSSSSSSLSQSPAMIQHLSCALCGITFDRSDHMKLLLHGQSMIIHVDLRQHVPAQPKMIAASSLLSSYKKSSSMNSFKKKRKHQDASSDKDHDLVSAVSSSNFSTVTLFRSIAHVTSLPDNRLVVIENPWMNILEKLPATLYRKRYGT